MAACLPPHGTYGATKIAISNFGEALHYELKQNVDVLVWEAGYIHSNIHRDPPPKLLTLNTDKAVSDVLSKLGKEKNTKGSLKVDMYPMFIMPSSAKFAKVKRAKFVENEKKTDTKYDDAYKRIQ